MTEQFPVCDFTDVEKPDYRGSYVFQIALVAIATVGLQVGLFLGMPEWLLSSRPPLVPPRKAPFRLNSVINILPGTAVFYDGELWVSTLLGMPSMQGIGRPTVTATSSQLVAIDPETGTPRETDLKLSPAPLGMLVIDDQIWAVAESAVHRIQKGRVMTRFPRRGLMQMTRPFVYEGKLAVIDKNKEDVYTLLTWNEGEWTEVAKVDIPESDPNARWFVPELRVLSDGTSLHLFFADAQTIWYREGIVLVSDTTPVSALRPANRPATPSALTNSTATRFYQQPQGWQKMPFGVIWGVSWEVAIVGGQPWAFCNGNANSNANTNAGIVQSYKKSSGGWIRSDAVRSAHAPSFSVVGNSPGYLVTDRLQVYAMDGSARTPPINSSIPFVEKIRYAAFFLGICVWHSIAMAVLGIGTWLLMRTRRSPDYLYGKRQAQHASLLLRGIARGIDTVATAVPPIFWLVYAVDSAPDFGWGNGMSNNQELLLFTVISIFGTWLAGIVVLSYMEGTWGITPGKWICGIRTFRTTLRPCGMLRSLAREFMVYVDGVMLVSWLPGVLSIALTKDWQRLGDLAADTIVVIDPKQSWSSHFATWRGDE